MKKLSRNEMKNVMGGFYLLCKKGGGTADAGDSCSQNDPGTKCSRVCKIGTDCIDQGSEIGGKCTKATD